MATANGALDYEHSGLAPALEPATFVMLGSGMIGLAGIVRRKLNL